VKTILRTVFLAALLALGGVAVAAGSADPAIGNWTLNVAKSKFNPGPAPKSDTRTYADTPQGLALTWNRVLADGKEVHVTATIKYDGKDYPVTGSPDFDTLAVTQVDGHTVTSVTKKGGKVVGRSTRVVSMDGKTLTLASKGTGPTGAPFDNVQVYDRR